MLELKNLSIGYETPILSDINCTSNGVIGLIGANGSGKTTLIKTIGGEIPALGGEIKLNNQLLTEIDAQDIGKLISVIYTNFSFSPQLNVKEVLQAGRIPYLSTFSKLTTIDIEVINKYVKKFDIGHLLHNKFTNLSDGQKQKVQLARALIQQTPLLLLDEPTAHLDLINKRYVFETIKAIQQQENKTVLIICHDLDNIFEYSNTIWLITKNNQFESYLTSSVNKSEIIQKLF